ncbi:MAG: hypothetical protein P8Y03_28225 [Anaerolineales bacterium]
MLREHRVRAHGPGRLFAPDALRGLIIVLMALDHANIFIAHKHSSGEYWGGAFPVYNDALAFLTRFVTHFCAPGFFLLMGAGMALFAHSRQERGWTRAEIIRHFLIRGGALILLQLLVVNRAWELTPGGWGGQPRLGTDPGRMGNPDLHWRFVCPGCRHDPGQPIVVAQTRLPAWSHGASGGWDGTAGS